MVLPSGPRGPSGRMYEIGNSTFMAFVFRRQENCLKCSGPCQASKLHTPRQFLFIRRPSFQFRRHPSCGGAASFFSSGVFWQDASFFLGRLTIKRSVILITYCVICMCDVYHFCLLLISLSIVFISIPNI